jgi:hypothetical protein
MLPLPNGLYNIILDAIGIKISEGYEVEAFNHGSILGIID